MDLLDVIQKKYIEFSHNEKKIAMYILQKNNEIKNINIQDLANAVDTSTSTVTRFCKKIGCEGFVDMKIKLSGAKPDVLMINDNPNVFDEVFSYYNKVIERTKRNFDIELINALVEEIERANRIFIYGVGSSGLTAMEITQRLLRMGLNVSSNTDSHMMIINSTIITKDDLVIGVSSSGSTPEVVDALKIAKKNKAKIVSFTSISDSEMSKISDLTLLVYNSSFVENNLFVNSQFAIIYLLDVLSLMLLEKREYSDKMQQTIEAITNKDT